MLTRLLGLFFLLLMLSAPVHAAADLAPRHDLGALSEDAIRFLRTLASGLGDASEITVTPPDTRLKLQQCPSPQFFLPPGSRAWGKLTMGVRCVTPVRWTLFLQARVRVQGTYWVAARNLAAGAVLQPADLALVHGDLDPLPAGAILQSTTATGKTLIQALSAGSVIQEQQLRTPLFIQQGQTIRAIGQGPGFLVSTEAVALNNANAGQPVRARTAQGQTLSGQADAPGQMRVIF